MAMTTSQRRSFANGRIRAMGMLGRQQSLGASVHQAALTVLEETVGQMIEDAPTMLDTGERGVVAFRLGMIDAMTEHLAIVCGLGRDYRPKHG